MTGDVICCIFSNFASTSPPSVEMYWWHLTNHEKVWFVFKFFCLKEFYRNLFWDIAIFKMASKRARYSVVFKLIMKKIAMSIVLWEVWVLQKKKILIINWWMFLILKQNQGKIHSPLRIDNTRSARTFPTPWNLLKSRLLFFAFSHYIYEVYLNIDCSLFYFTQWWRYSWKFSRRYLWREWL